GDKKREFLDWTYWGKPVPGFGDPSARLLIVGLAPAAHGANRTGRMFTGDSSGDWLYAALHRYGFASQPRAISRDDGLTLVDCYITGAARCAGCGSGCSSGCDGCSLLDVQLCRDVVVVRGRPRARSARCAAPP